MITNQSNQSNQSANQPAPLSDRALKVATGVYFVGVALFLALCMVVVMRVLGEVKW